MGNKMLVVDGVKYKEWIPEKEVEEFQPIVKEHVQDIFGSKSKYIEASRLKSEAGMGSVPDGFVLVFGDSPQWHIVEVELSSHQLYDHIVNQVGRFINGIKNPATQKNIIDTIYQEITVSKISKVGVEEEIGSGEIHKFLSDLISQPPILTIIIEKKTPELEEAINLLKYSPIKIVEFRTFRREGAEAVHAHLFEPLYKPVIPTVSEPLRPETHVDSMRIKIWRSYIEYGYIGIWKKFRDLFPNAGKTIEIINGDGEIFYADVGDYEGSKQLWDLQKWYRKHPELKEGDIIRITPVVPMKKYRFEIIK